MNRSDESRFCRIFLHRGWRPSCAIFALVFVLSGLLSCSVGSTTVDRSAEEGTEEEHSPILPEEEYRLLEAESAEAFHVLLERLEERYPLSDEEHAKVKRRLEAWDDRLRIIPTAWLEEPLVDQRSELLSYGRAVSISNLELTSQEIDDFLSQEQVQRLLPHISHLEFSHIRSLENSDIVKILSHSELNNLTGLELRGRTLEAQDLERILNSSGIYKLTHLNLRWNRLNNDALEILEESSKFDTESIKILNLGNNPMSSNRVTEFLLSGEFTELEKLTLDGTAYGMGGMSEFVEMIQSDAVKGISSLSLQDTSLNARYIQVIAESENLSELERLYIGFNRLSRRAFRWLGSSEFINLKHLSLPGATFGRAGSPLREISEGESFENLEVLDLSKNRWVNENFDYLLNSEFLPNLRVLELQNTSLTGENLNRLVHSEVTDQIEVLDLSENELGNEGARIIANGNDFGQLRCLGLRGVGLENDGLQYLGGAAATGFERLTRLFLTDNDLSWVGVKSLLQSWRDEGTLSINLVGNRIHRLIFDYTDSPPERTGPTRMNLESWNKLSVIRRVVLGGEEGRRAILVGDSLQQLCEYFTSKP